MDTLAGILKENAGKQVILLAHHNADPDAVCSAIALSLGLKELNYKVKIGVVDSASSLSKKILTSLNKEVKVNPKLDSDLIILLDTSTRGQLSGFAKTFAESKAKKMLIDHHAVQEEAIEVDHKFVDEKATSTTELVYDLLKKLNIPISKDMAMPIIVGMIAETAHFRFSTLKNLKIITELMEEHNIELKEALKILTLTSDISERIARLKALKRATVHRIKDYLVVTSYIKSFEASSARALIKVGADLAAVAAKREDEVRVSLRATSAFTDNTGIDLGKDLIGKVAKIIEGTGSGHPTAAGANGKAINKAEEALESIVNYVKEKVE